ncbi:type 4a pilus biogenesis protein PilO [Anaerohalosphaera lusitana]|nr:type 4a pilus biogenesis protein PilO [Anaerohalosphaera lusitana]
MQMCERQQLLIIAVALGILGIFGAAIYAPLARQTMRLKTTKASVHDENGKVKSQIERIPSTVREKRELAAAVGDFEAKIPTERRFAQVWEQLAEVMNEEGLTDQLIQPGVEVKGKDELVCIPLSIECTGDLGQIYAFFRSLEELERLIRVDRLEISEDKDSDGKLKMTANAKIFYRRSKTT